MCLRGIDTLTALGLCAEIGDFHRFRRPAQLMSYLGVVPSEHSTGEQAPAGLDHQVRQPARPPAARRGRLALPAPAAGRGASSRAARPASPQHRARSPGRRSGGCIAPGSAWTQARQAPHDRRGRRRARARRLLLGGRDRRLTRAAARRWSRRRRDQAPSRQRIRDTAMSNRHPAVTLDPRQRALRRNPVLRPPGSAHISLTARRAPGPTRRPLDQQKGPLTRAFRAAHLTNRRPYQL